MIKLVFRFSFCIILISCSNDLDDSSKNIQFNRANSDLQDDELEQIQVSFPDDIYKATVDYYNPNTGNSSTYTLDVEVFNNTVTVIHFNNGGWLDETHIVSGGELDESGISEIESDKGYIYTVTIDH